MLSLITDSPRDLEGKGEFYQLWLTSKEDSWATYHIAGKYGGCSCHFRNVILCEPLTGSIDAWFGPVEDWMPEDPEDVESTEHLHDLVAELLAEGSQVYISNDWNNETVDFIEADVSITQVPREHLRFLEGYRFRMLP